jgi:hypothetical protein
VKVGEQTWAKKNTRILGNMKPDVGEEEHEDTGKHETVKE